MTADVRERLRCGPFGWVLLAVAVALLVLGVRAAGLVAVTVLITCERLVAVVVAAAGWADEYASGRAGMPVPLAATPTSGRCR
jgi:hypothetical protein